MVDIDRYLADFVVIVVFTVIMLQWRKCFFKCVFKYGYIIGSKF